MSRITINGISMDPVAPHPAMALAAFQAPDARQSNYILIQTDRPLDKEQKKILSEIGAGILEYIPDDTYLCRYEPADLSAIRALPFVRWVNVYMEGFKIAGALLPVVDKSSVKTLEAAMIRPAAAFDADSRLVDVVFQQGADKDKLRAEIAAAAHLSPDHLELDTHKARLTVQVRYLKDLAAIDDVRHIEAAYPRKLLNDVARGIIWQDALPAANGLSGKGQLVAIADTGLDKGLPGDMHPAFSGRVVKIYALGRPGDGSDPHSHGTHVAGSVLGSYHSPALGQQIDGMAPGAKLVFQSVLASDGSLGGLPNDLHQLFGPPYQNDGVRIHTNSWGSSLGDSRYDTEAYEVDDFVWHNRDMVICFAAGNEGKDVGGSGRVQPGSLTPPGTAKNCITIGASENMRPDFPLTYGDGWPQFFPAGPIHDDPVANNADGMAAFSSRGPTSDNRIKPDVVAPGTYILSALSRAVQGRSGWAPSADPLLMFDGGTSMATPLVAGSVAIIREFLITRKAIASPSAALVKALLINGAKMISGQYNPSETGLVPNVADGFGRIDLSDITSNLPSEGEDNWPVPGILQLFDESTALDTNDSQHHTLELPAIPHTLKVTLAWTDPPGEKLQNDLDLIVRHSNGEERHGNMPAGSTAFDRDNNVEQVMWTGIGPGTVTITVRAYRVPAFAQSYALVVRTE